LETTNIEARQQQAGGEHRDLAADDYYRYCRISLSERRRLQPAHGDFVIANQPPLAFGIKQAEHPHMKPRAQTTNPTAGALRASRAVQHDPSLLEALPELIDRETGVREILEILQSIIAEAGDLIESRSPELVAAARAVLTRYHDEGLGQAE
jgi:hypothetical protein